MLRLYSADLEFHRVYLQKLADEASAGLTEAVDRFARNHDKFKDLPIHEIVAARPTLEDAQQTSAREHGFDSWQSMSKQCRAIETGEMSEPAIHFFKSVEANDLNAVETCLGTHPDLVNAIASTGKAALHKSTTREMVQLLLDHGADPTLETPLPGGSGLMHAIIWGFTAAANAIGEHSRMPDNLRVAAGLGDLAMMAAMFDGSGQLQPGARARRAYYRPNYGWYPWQPSDDPQEVLDEALILAATNGRLDAMAAILDRGAGIDGKAYETTALIRATWKNQLEAVDWLLDRGADVNATGWLGGHVKGATALHIAASDGHDELVRLLIARGADLSLTDPLYNGTPEGWAEHSGAKATANLIRQLARV